MDQKGQIKDLQIRLVDVENAFETAIQDCNHLRNDLAFKDN